MEKTAPVNERAVAEDRLRSTVEVIAGLRQQIEAMKDEAETGGEIDIELATKLVNKLNEAVMICCKVETKIDEHRNKQAGIAQGCYALDLDRARAEIGCKLDKLRQCGDPEAVS